MKKFLKASLVLVLALLMSLMLFACNNDSDSTDEEGTIGDNEGGSTYTITFDTNSDDFTLSESKATIENVAYGSYIAAPTDDNGDKITPVKKGYTFTYWSSDKSAEFDFATTQITSDLTLTAMYTNNVYYHEHDHQAILEYTYDSETESYKYSISETKLSDDYTLSAADFDDTTTTIKSTYASSTYLDNPTTTAADEFCFWYYLDSEGTPVQFTKWRTDGSTQSSMLSSYAFTSSLTLYAMWKSTLPTVTVNFYEAEPVGETPATLNSSKEKKVNDYLTDSDLPELTKAGYEFKYWYYLDADGEEVEFTLYSTEDNYATIEEVITANLDEDEEINYFEPTSIALYPKWQKLVALSSTSEYDNMIAIMSGDDEDAKKELMEAKINIENSIDFGGKEVSMIFDADHVFTGIIEAKASDIVLSNFVLTGTKELSLFGYVDGEILGYYDSTAQTWSSLSFESISYKINKITVDETEKYEDVIYVAPVAISSKNTINYVNVKLGTFEISGSEADLNKVVFGGVVAFNSGSMTDSDTGIISNVSVTAGTITIKSKSLTFGGIAAEADSGSRIKSNKVEITDILVTENGNSNNGAETIIGGIVGANAGVISDCTSTIEVGTGEVDTNMYLGGIAGNNMGSVGLSSSNLTVLASLALSGDIINIGGAIGENGGYIINSYANITATLSFINELTLNAGGLIGKNYSNIKESTSTTTTGTGCINYTYSTGSIIIESKANAKATVNAGGLVGYNKFNYIKSNFSTVDITITNPGLINNAGLLIGNMDEESTITTGWYVQDKKVTINSESVDGTVLGDAVEVTSFADSTFVIGSDSSLLYSEDVWEIKDGAALPTLK